jgi:DUF177 domain-containing protein
MPSGYSGAVTTFNLRTVKLRPSEEFRGTLPVALEPLEFGGQRYVAGPRSPEASLTIGRASSGTLFRLAFETTLSGPCFRCLATAAVRLAIDATEYQAESPDSEELRTPYLKDDRLDLSAWAHDAVALSLPDKILCRNDCAGLCAVCGRDLNLEPHAHAEDVVDARWAELAKLRDRLG